MSNEINLHDTRLKDKTKKQWLDFLYDCFVNERTLILFGTPLHVKTFLIDTDYFDKKTATVIFSNEMSFIFPNYNFE